MQMLKRTAALLAATALCCTLLAGCTRDSDGLSLSAAVGSAPQTLDPIYAETVSEQTVLVHLYENLMRLSVDANGTTSAVSGMAKSVDSETNVDGTVTYTFRLRSAKWSDGRAVKAADFVYAWRRLIDPANESPHASLLQVVCGYEEARESGDLSLLQVSAKNDATLVVVLNGNYDWFLRDVCTAPATMPLREDVVGEVPGENTGEDDAQSASSQTEQAPWWSDPTALVVNGPYLVTDWQEGTALTAAASEKYYNHSKHNGPAAIRFCFTGTAEEAEALYDSGEADVLWPLTQEALTALAADEAWTAIPTLSTGALVFNCAYGPFQDQSIRQAVVKAIDRNALAAAAGVTASAAEGLVPRGVPENEEGDFRARGGAIIDNDPQLYAQNCLDAQEMLAAAGYESGAELGELEYLYVDEGNGGVVASELCRQLRTAIGMQLTPVPVSAKEMEVALQNGGFTMAGVELMAECNDAESFLMDWISDSEHNVARYENSAYDTLMSIIATAADGTARMGCLHDAEDLLLSDAALTPLFQEGTAWKLRENLVGALRDPRGWFSFSGVVTRTV
ncbi:MAG: peptide ABC transporter substrate-binding protein [Oscillospiraceae bacterium]|nr:peptide ABC transporter substrate-binding protein [Oscillospiraceae bacterium]